VASATCRSSTARGSAASSRAAISAAWSRPASTRKPASGSASERLPARTRAAAFWQVPADELRARSGAGADGLSAREAARRLAAAGRNVQAHGRARSLAGRLGRRLLEPLVAILVAAAILSGIFGDWVGTAIIVAIVAGSTILDVVQERRAQDAADALRRSVAVRTRVRRDGRVVAIDAADVVVGDVVLLGAGDLVPADGIVLSATAAHVDQALLTGEPYPVEKRPGPSGAAELADAFDAVFGGTTVTAGEIAMLVVAAGAGTRLGGIAAALDGAEPPTAFAVGLHGLGILILRLTVFLVLFVLLAHLASQRPFLDPSSSRWRWRSA
jgi:Mg2+-importing ATPase